MQGHKVQEERIQTWGADRQGQPDPHAARSVLRIIIVHVLHGVQHSFCASISVVGLLLDPKEQALFGELMKT